MIRKRILVVDDQPHIARITRMVLEHAGRFEVAVETHPGSVLERAREMRPDAIVLDFHMPGKNGAELAREIWLDASLENTPILFFCGMSPDAEMNITAPKGPVRFLSKLTPPKVLIAEVEAMVSCQGDVPRAA